MVSIRTGSLGAWCLGLIAAFACCPVQAEPAREALVIGNGTYTAFAALPGCLLSAHSVAAALRNLGFDVTEREDASSGATDAAISEFAQHLGVPQGSSAVVYVCAYATAYNDRPFLLPISAAVSRPTDVLTQGFLAKSLIDTLARVNAAPALLALDVVPLPGAPASL